MKQFQIATARLILKPTSLEDFEEWMSASAPDVTGNETVSAQELRTAQWFYFRWLAGCWYLDGFSKFSVVERSSGRLVGIVGPTQPDGWSRPEVGWTVISDRQHRGYATEAATAAVDWVFNTRSCDEITFYIGSENASSQNVAKKLGCYNTGPGKAPTPFYVPVQFHLECDIWIQTRDRWRSLRSQA